MREIACDESGYEGNRLVGGVTSVFAHAGVALGLPDAAACVAELRRRIRPARPLTPSGPPATRAYCAAARVATRARTHNARVAPVDAGVRSRSRP